MNNHLSNNTNFSSAPGLSSRVETQTVTRQGSTTMERGGNDFPGITDAAISAHILARLDDVLRHSKYAHVTVGVAAFDTSVVREPVFRIVAGDALTDGEGASFDEAFDRLMAKIGGRPESEILREKAAALMARAEELEEEGGEE